MSSVPELPPPSHGGPPPRGQRTVAQPASSVEPVRYVAWLLLWQGVAWLVLATAGLGFWIAARPAGPGPASASASAAVPWASAQLLAIAIGACVGAAEAGMACQLRGGPRWVLAMAAGLQGVTLAAGLVVAAVIVMIAGSVLELLAISGAFLACFRLMAET